MKVFGALLQSNYNNSLTTAKNVSPSSVVNITWYQTSDSDITINLMIAPNIYKYNIYTGTLIFIHSFHFYWWLRWESAVVTIVSTTSISSPTGTSYNLNCASPVGQHSLLVGSNVKMDISISFWDYYYYFNFICDTSPPVYLEATVKIINFEISDRWMKVYTSVGWTLPVTQALGFSTLVLYSSASSLTFTSPSFLVTTFDTQDSYCTINCKLRWKHLLSDDVKTNNYYSIGVTLYL